MRVCAVDVAVCEHVRARREFTRWQLISCLTFPVSQGSSRKNNAEKPPTADNRNATKRQRKRLLAGDWIIAVVWDRRQGKYANDCTMFGADAQHLPDPSTHPSPSALHNSRNTLKKRKEPWVTQEGKGMRDKYCVCIFPPSPFQLFSFQIDSWTLKVFWTFAACYLLVVRSEPSCLSPSHCGWDWFITSRSALSSPSSFRKTLGSEILFWTHRLRNDWLSSCLIIKVGFKIQNLKKVILLKRQPNASRA